MSKSVFSKEEAERVAVAYNPRKFPSVITPAAHDFVAYQTKQTDESGTPSFRIDKIVAEQTGVAELERISIEEKVEQEALARLKELQEQAYQQAYQLGLDEGREQAFQEQRAEIDAKLSHFEALLASIQNLKTDLVNQNESHIVRLVYYIAKRLVLDEIADRRELTLNIVRQAIESAQSEENVTVRVSGADFAFIDDIKGKLGKEFELLKQVKFESSDEISDGGCVVETNYGDVDATIEQRFERLWTSISEKLPKPKSVIGG